MTPGIWDLGRVKGRGHSNSLLLSKGGDFWFLALFSFPLGGRRGRKGGLLFADWRKEEERKGRKGRGLRRLAPLARRELYQQEGNPDYYPLFLLSSCSPADTAKIGSSKGPWLPSIEVVFDLLQFPQVAAFCVPSVRMLQGLPYMISDKKVAGLLHMLSVKNIAGCGFKGYLLKCYSLLP